jgi:hypothetical protein
MVPHAPNSRRLAARNFQDVRGRPRYRASHVVPLEELPGVLANPATTPNFAWIAPDDWADMEGYGGRTRPDAR